MNLFENPILVKTTIKYPILIVIIYSLLTIIPQNKLTLANKMTILIIIVMSIIIYDLLNNQFIGNMKNLSVNENFENQQQVQQQQEEYKPNSLSMYEPLGNNVPRWTNGYSYMCTDKWSVPEKRPPVCTTNKPSLVRPYAFATDLLQFEDAGKITENANSIDQGYTLIQNIEIPQ